jgi:prepilin-type N-terminal cleavage/methylation domain-containing protein
MLNAKLKFPAKRHKVSAFSLQPSAFACAGFTMVEIAICLAIIGFALVAIIGVLPIGMNTQRDNREETIINQDATIFIEAIRNGAQGLDDLTNYVYAITNNWTLYKTDGTTNVGVYGYANYPSFLTNGANIVGLLSTPEYADFNGFPTNNLFSGGISNHIVAYVRSMSGPAVEKPPQDNQIIQADAFGYRLLCVNAPVAMDTNIFGLPAAQQSYTRQLAANLHELRLTFLWPQLPNGGIGPGRQTWRTMIAGQLARNPGNTNLYFYQSQSFVKVTNAP